MRCLGTAFIELWLATARSWGLLRRGRRGTQDEVKGKREQAPAQESGSELPHSKAALQRSILAHGDNGVAVEGHKQDMRG